VCGGHEVPWGRSQIDRGQRPVIAVANELKTKVCSSGRVGCRLPGGDGAILACAVGREKNENDVRR
jgi:hypothetical protein